MLLEELYKEKLLTDWIEVLRPALESKELRQAIKFVRKIKKEVGSDKVFPQEYQMFDAFRYCEPNDIKVVLLGAHPWEDDTHNIGLSYAHLLYTRANLETDEMTQEIRRTASLLEEQMKNKYKVFNALDSEIRDLQGIIDYQHEGFEEQEEVEIRLHNLEARQERELGFMCMPDYPGSTECSHHYEMWAHQGVLMLNTALTVNEGNEDAHLEAWKPFAKEVIKSLSDDYSNIVYVCWDSRVKDVLDVVPDEGNLVLKIDEIISSDIFTETNGYISNWHGVKKTIDWSLGTVVDISRT